MVRVAGALGCLLLVVVAVLAFLHAREESAPPPKPVQDVAVVAAPSSPASAASSSAVPDSPSVAVVKPPSAVAGKPSPVAVSSPVPRPVPAAAASTATNGCVGVRPSARQVRLANRTITLEEGRRRFPKKFAELQTPSARKTVPYVVVSELPVSELVRQRARACGARVIGFMPVNSLIVEAGEVALRKLADDPFFAGAYEVDPKDKVQAHVREDAVARPTKVDVTVVPLMATDVDALGAFVKTQGGAVIPASDERPVLRARVPAAAVDALAGRGDVRWIERYVPATLQNNVAVNADHNLMNVRAVWDTHGLTGDGQNITVSDTGIDTDNVKTLMGDFKNRVYAIRKAATFGMSSEDTDGHGTHVAGSIVGNGNLSNGEIKGVAHGARIYMWNCLTAKGGLSMPSTSSMFLPDDWRFVPYIHSASWGCTATASYTAYCNEIDDFVWSHPTFLPVFAAGNADGTASAGTVMDPSTAKNVLSVGATESYRPTVSYYADNPAQMAYFSLQGPTTDGRIKPDICAPGTYILSTRTTRIPQSETVGWLAYTANSNYTYMGGTSMATPLVAGSAALVREWLVNRRGFTNAVPTAALVKAILMGGARDMSVYPNANCGGAAPNNRQGWGSVNLCETLFPSNRSVKLVDSIPFSTGSEHVVRVMTTNAAPLDVQLVWIDYPADPSAGTMLVNDLDLVVSNETTGATWWGNGATGGDRRNNVESVRIVSVPAGTYAIHVKGERVPHASSEGGAAALYVRGALVAGTKDEFAGQPATPWYGLKRRSHFPELSDWGTDATDFYPSGVVAHVSVPADLPMGSEVLRGLWWTNDDTGEESPLGPQRLAEVRVGGVENADEVQRDSAGRMATAFDVTMDGDREVWFDYYDEGTLNAATGLPEWWWRKCLAADPAATASVDTDGDGIPNGAEYAADTDPTDRNSVFRILSISPTNLVWRGGQSRTQVVERTDCLGPAALWKGVFTNPSPTKTECSFDFPRDSATNAFYRIRAL